MFKHLPDRAARPTDAGRRARAALALLLALAAVAAPPAAATATIVYVKPGASGSGTSWANAANLTPALIVGAASGSEIWVAAGTYRPSAPGNRAASFTLKNGVAIYGGFAGTETQRSQRNIGANRTILSGDLLANDTGVISTTNPTRADNSYHVVSGGGADATAVLDGVTISEGNASGGPELNGGGMDNGGAGPTLTNISFSGNSAVFGGGMYNTGGPTLTNVSFGDNFAHHGGGMYNTGSPTLANVSFSGNTTFEGVDAAIGGGMYNTGNPTLTNVSFSGNSAEVGGGIYNDVGSPTLTNVSFSGNSAGFGGGMKNESGSPTLTNVSFSGNSAGTGGGMYNDVGSPVLTSVTVSGNSAQSAGGGIFNNSTNLVTLTNSIVAGNTGTGATSPDCYGILISQGYNLLGNNAGCTFTPTAGDQVGTPASSIDPRLGPLTDNGGLTPTRALLSGSPAIDAIPSGASGCGTASTLDQRGVLRPQGAGCDIGAYELVPPNTTSTSVGVAGQTGFTDGYTTTVRFDAPASIAANQDGSLALVVDSTNHNVRKIIVATGYVTTLAGLADNPGFTDGYTTTARFDTPSGVALSADGTLALIADSGNHTIRKIDVATGYVATLAGLAGQPGSTDDYTRTARFNTPYGVALSADGALALVADSGNHTIRRIDVATGQVTTLAGHAGQPGSADGVGDSARFDSPSDVALSADGRFALVADSGNNLVRRIDVLTGEVLTLAAVGLRGAIGVTASGGRIQGISLDPSGCTALVADGATHTITKVDATTGITTTLAGQVGAPGSGDGAGGSARFNTPEGVALTNGGVTALVADTGNSTVRRIDGVPICRQVYLPLVRQ